MKPLQRITCIKEIIRNLNERAFTWDEVYSYLHEYSEDVRYYKGDDWGSLDEYVLIQCDQFHDETLLSIHDELYGNDSIEISGETNVSSLWRAGYYRLFISHLTKDKVAISNLKKCLARYGIDCFVAHEDIEPSKEWIKEIKKALRSADALCAVFSPGFCESKWCDQEVGTALGRRIPVISIKKGADPHGFLSEFQAIRPRKYANEIAEDLFNTLCSIDNANARLFPTLTKLLLDSSNKEDASNWIGVIIQAKNYPNSEVSTLYEKCRENSVLRTEELTIKLNTLFSRINRKIQKLSTTINDSDLPF